MNELSKLENQLKEAPQTEQSPAEEENMDLDTILQSYEKDLNCETEAG